MADEQYHLWRYFNTAPFRRFACTVTPTEEADDGYKIVDYDPAVADATFLHQLHDHMLRPTLVNRSEGDEKDRIVEMIDTAPPKAPGHFREAIRTFPGSVLRGVGRS